MRKITILSIIVTVCFIAAQGVFAGTYVGVPKGTICQAYVDYNDSNTVTITAGYGECNGNYWEITTPINHGMTSLTTSEDFHYIYIDDANSDYSQPTIIDSNTEPAWSDSKLGWYNGDDRCVGVVWTAAGSATIMHFSANSQMIFIVDGWYKQVLSNGNPNGADQLVTCAAYIPVNAISIGVIAANDSATQVEVATEDCLTARVTEYTYSSGYANARGWLMLKRNGSRNLVFKGANSDGNTFRIYLMGYQTER